MVVVDDDLAARGNRLARQDPPLVHLVGAKGVVHAHRDPSVVEVGHAGPAVSLLAGERWLESRTPCGFENGIAALVPDAALPAFQADHDRLRLGWFAGRGCLVGQLEPLDEQPTRIDSSLIEAGLDDLHVRPGAAHVEVGLRPVPDERGAGRGVEEPLSPVQVMMYREAAAGPRAGAF